MIEDDFAAPLQPADVRQMTRIMKDVRAAHDGLDAKILNVLDALQDQEQSQTWFNDWQAKVDVRTKWIYKWQSILNRAVDGLAEAADAASSTGTNAMDPDQSSFSGDGDSQALHARITTMTPLTMPEIITSPSDVGKFISTIPVAEESTKFTSESPRAGNQSSRSLPEKRTPLPIGGQFRLPVENHERNPLSAGGLFLHPTGGCPIEGPPIGVRSSLLAGSQLGGLPQLLPARGLPIALPADGCQPEMITLPFTKPHGASKCSGEGMPKLLVSRRTVERI